MNDEALVLTRKDARGVVTLTLNRPQAFNALSEAMLDALQAALDAVAADDAARVVVIAAAGKAFCAGHDLKEMRTDPSQGYYERLFAQCGRMMMTIQRLPVPVIARVHGPAAGVGEATAMNVDALADTGAALVIDADALTSFEHRPGDLFAVLDRDDVLTPHEGEFKRLFPGVLEAGREAAALEAARRSGAVIRMRSI